MCKLLRMGVATSLILSFASASENFTDMFTKAKASGQLKVINAVNNFKSNDLNDTHATAFGGQLKYELAEYYGLSAGFAFSTSGDITLATGSASDGEQNDELSSSTGDYTVLSESYINYNIGGLNIRSGRQMIDTPLADSDDIRMIANTFNADVITYELSSFNFTAGSLREWQGVDAGLDDGWQKTGENGTLFAGITYSEAIDLNAWYYKVSERISATYMDVGISREVGGDVSFALGVQYLSESELNDSGEAASIYGLMAELSAYDIGIGFGYNVSNKIADKASFSGFGGGTMYTSMDTMIIDEITADRSASAMMLSLNYEISNFNIFYAIGSFKGEADSLDQTAHIVEHNAGVEYNLDDEFMFSAIYVLENDKDSDATTANDWNRIQTSLAYSF